MTTAQILIVAFVAAGALVGAGVNLERERRQQQDGRGQVADLLGGALGGAIIYAVCAVLVLGVVMAAIAVVLAIA